MKSQRFQTPVQRCSYIPREKVDEPLLESGTTTITSTDGLTSSISQFKLGEVGVRLVNKDASTEAQSVRVRVALTDNDGRGPSLVILSNGKVYLSHEQFGIVRYDEELNTKELNHSIEQMKYHVDRIGNTTELKTVTKSDIVSALNELTKRVNCPRRLIGSVKWLLLDKAELSKYVFEDLERLFDYEEKRWKYYSDAAEDWYYMPEGWQKLNIFIRRLNELKSVKAKFGDTCGILEEESIVVFNGENWEPRFLQKDESGDEYVAQFIIGKGYNGNKSGSIVLAGGDWIYTI